MKLKKIQDFSFAYECFRILYFRPVFNHVYYKKVVVNGFENLPNDRPVILAPNHQNALMDPLALVSKLKHQPVFLARQDVFRGGVISAFLHWVKIMPIYRIRDGIESLTKNDEIFNKSLDVLKDNKQLCLMAEGNHGNRRHLRPLMKGLLRIAFMAQSAFKSAPGVIIIPVGLEYSHYYKFRQTLIINFGQPIEINQYYDLYSRDAPRAFNLLKEHLCSAMSSVMLDIRSEKYYEAIYFLQQIAFDAKEHRQSRSQSQLLNRFAASQALVKKIDLLAVQDENKMQQLNEMALAYRDGLQHFKLREWLFYNPLYSFFNLFVHTLTLLIFLPVFIFGYLNNLVLYYLPLKPITKIKDLQFHSSVIFAIGWFMAPIYYLILFLLVWLISKSSIFALVYAVTSVITGVIAFDYYISWLKWKGKLRYNHLQGKVEFEKLNRLRNNLLEQLWTI